jgi:hypothetical protein
VCNKFSLCSDFKAALIDYSSTLHANDGVAGIENLKLLVWALTRGQKKFAPCSGTSFSNVLRDLFTVTYRQYFTYEILLIYLYFFFLNQCIEKFVTIEKLHEHSCQTIYLS